MTKALRWVGARTLIGAMIVAVAALAIAAVNRHALLEWIVLDALHDQGIERASLTVESFTFNQITIENVRIGEHDLMLQTLHARYSMTGLLRRHLDELRIDGLRIHGNLDETGIGLGALDTLLGVDDAEILAPAGIPALPMSRLIVTNASVVIDTAGEPFTATLDVSVDDSGAGDLSLNTSALRALDTDLALEVAALEVTGSVAYDSERIDLHLDPASFDLTLANENGSQRVVGTTPSLDVSAEPGGIGSTLINVNGGDVALTDSGLALRGFDAELRVDAATRLPVGRIAVGEIRDPREPAAFPPLKFAAEIEPTDGGITFDAELEGAAGRLKLHVEGVHDAASGVGHADLSLAPLRLADGGLQPKDLAPAFAKLVPAADGTIVATGELAWGDDELAGFVDLGVSNLTLHTGGAVMERINAALRIDQPWQPRIAPGQLVSMARVDFGLELTNGLVRYELQQDGVVAIESAEWEFAGGTLRTQGSFDLAADEQSMLLSVHDVDLASLLQRVNIDGLSGSGTLNGKLPIVLRGDTVEIRQGVLEASSEGGWIYYAPEGKALALAGAAGAAFDDLLVALMNFNYETLRLAVNGAAQGDVTVAVTLHGVNPDHRDAQPYEFNLNVDGQLGDMVRQENAAYKIPALIQERVDAIAAGAQ